jgi:hypothetical protein
MRLVQGLPHGVVVVALAHVEEEAVDARDGAGQRVVKLPQGGPERV